MKIQMKRVNAIVHDDLFCRLISMIDEKEKDRIFCRHGMDHLLDVARIAYIISLEESMNIPKDIIYTAALLHDIGRADPDNTGERHHVLSVSLAGKVMENCGFDEKEIVQVLDAIDSHNTDGDSREGLAYILYKADKLSRDCFSCNARSDCYWPSNEKNMDIQY
ncbi:MAG: HD domain-containing protein [Coprococcus sp.]|nr:HD domain-containing protein [Coprococcus sp.]